MKRLILWTLTLIFLTTGLTGGVVAYARKYGGENPIRAYGLDNCDGKVCLTNVSPGMLWSKARSLLTDRIEKVSENDALIMFRLGIGDEAYLRANDSKENVAVISLGLSVDSAFPPVGYVVGQYGPPCKAVVVPFPNQVDQLILIYPTMFFSINWDTNRVFPFSKVSKIAMYSSSDYSDQCTTGNYKGIIAKRWSGFRGSGYYLTN